MTPQQRLDALYARLPAIACQQRCAWHACTPVAMRRTEWERIVQTLGFAPVVRHPQQCALLNPVGGCNAYALRPFVCRLYGLTKDLACPHGCQPERWLREDEVRALFDELSTIDVRLVKAGW
jgi:hypothetical protein